MVCRVQHFSEIFCISYFVSFLRHFFLLAVLIEMWIESETGTQRNKTWPSNCPCRVTDSNPVFTLLPTLLLSGRIIKGNLTSSPNDQPWSRLQSMIGVWWHWTLLPTSCWCNDLISVTGGRTWRMETTYKSLLLQPYIWPCCPTHSHGDMGPYGNLICLQHRTSRIL